MDIEWEYIEALRQRDPQQFMQRCMDGSLRDHAREIADRARQRFCEILAGLPDTGEQNRRIAEAMVRGEFLEITPAELLQWPVSYGSRA